MKKITYLTLLMVLLGFAAPINSQTKSNREWIQGTWRISGSNGTMAWFMEWTFADGNFIQEGYPPLLQKGKYRLLKDENNTLVLELYKQEGTFGNEQREIEIVLDKKKNQLSINKKEGFKKQKVTKSIESEFEFMLYSREEKTIESADLKIVLNRIGKKILTSGGSKLDLSYTVKHKGISQTFTNSKTNNLFKGYLIKLIKINPFGKGSVIFQVIKVG